MRMTDVLPTQMPGAPAEAFGHRIQQSLQVILAGLDEQGELSASDTEDLRRDLRRLLQRERIEIAAAEMDKAELVLGYMIRPKIEDCLNLWFGKSERTDQEIWTQFGAEVALASGGHYDHWALDVEHPRLLVALVIMLDQFPRNMYRDTPQMYACDAHCLSLVKRGSGPAAAEACDRSNGFSFAWCSPTPRR